MWSVLLPSHVVCRWGTNSLWLQKVVQGEKWWEYHWTILYLHCPKHIQVCRVWKLEDQWLLWYTMNTEVFLEGWLRRSIYIGKLSLKIQQAGLMMCVCTCSNAKVLTKLVHQCYVYSTSLPDSLTTVRNTGIRKSGNKGILCIGICFQTMPGVLGIYYLLGINTEHGVHVPCNNDLRAIQHNSSVWSSLLHIQSNLLP